MYTKSPSESEYLLDFNGVIETIGISISKTTLWRWELQGRFPKRVKLAGTRVAWLRTEVLEWLRLHVDKRANIHYCEPR